jgi:hypothetical protein
MNPTFLFNELFWKLQPSVAAGATASTGGVIVASSSFDINSIVCHARILWKRRAWLLLFQQQTSTKQTEWFGWFEKRLRKKKI